jgi:hypothetical protein
MAGDAEGDAKGDAKGRAAARVPKIAVESTATQNKNRKKRGREDGEAQPGAAKKARLARRSKEIPPPEGEGAASVNAVNDGEDGDGSKTNNKESKTQRYILFIGNVLPLSSPFRTLSELSASREPQVHHNARSNPEPLLPMRCVHFSPAPHQTPTRLPHVPRPTPDGTPPHAQSHTCWCDDSCQVQEVQRLRVPRVHNTARAAGSATPTPV